MIEKPRAAIAANAPMMVTGTAARGMMEARQFCRNSTTTRTTRIRASKSVCTTALMLSCTKIVVS